MSGPGITFPNKTMISPESYVDNHKERARGLLEDKYTDEVEELLELLDEEERSRMFRELQDRFYTARESEKGLMRKRWIQEVERKIKERK